MPAAAIVSAVVGGVGAIQSGKAAKTQNDIAQSQLDIQTKNSYLQGLNAVRDYDKSIADMEGAKIQYGIDIRDARSQVESYDKWLANYSNQYAQEVQSKQAQTDSLMASGKETYENFLNAIGYADAMAGATGRVGAGTSQAATTAMFDRKLVDYVGEDRTLDAKGGLFGSQLTAANMEMEQLKVDLDFQRQEMTANRNLANSSIADWQRAISLTDESIANSKAAKNDLQNFIDKNFGAGSGSGSGYNNPAADTAKRIFDPLGLILKPGQKQSAGDIAKGIFDPLGLFH